MKPVLSHFALAAALVGLGCGSGGGGKTAGTGGVTTSGGSTMTGGVAATGGVSMSGGANTGGASTGGQPATGGAPSGGSNTGGRQGSGGSIGGQPATGGNDAGGGGRGGAGGGGQPSGGSSTGGSSAGGSSAGGSSAGGSSAGGMTAGGASGAGTGGAGSTGTGGSQLCDTSWDTYAKKDGIALTPPMAWNSWNAFHESINEQQIKQVADVMVSSGMKDAGYQYLNLDDRWMDDDGRDAQGKLYGDSVRFPSGMKSLADYVHGLGLKLGVYGDRGTATCANVKESGSYGKETIDAQTFAAWGVDYLKYDNCNVGSRTSDQAQREDYEKMSAALKATGRPIVFSICAWDWKGEWMAAAGHLWRSTFDIGPCFSGCKEWYRNIDQIIDENNLSAQFAGPGHWNDPDMLEVGNPGLTNTEATAHFSMWAIMAAPLIAGNDIRTMSSQTRDILTNKEVIAVDQDLAGIQGTRVVDNGDLEVWMKPLCNRNGPEKAVALLNRSGSTAKITVSFSGIGVSGTATVRDLWAHKDLGEYQGSFSADVASHGVVMVRIVATKG
jgi:alpha-galactosidase